MLENVSPARALFIVVWIFGMNFHHKGPRREGGLLRKLHGTPALMCARPNFRGEGLSLFYARREMAECVFVSQKL